MYSASWWGYIVAPGHDGYQRAFFLISGPARYGHSGHQISNAPADCCAITWISLADLGGFLLLFPLRFSSWRSGSDAPGFVVALTGEHAPGDARQFVG